MTTEKKYMTTIQILELATKHRVFTIFNVGEDDPADVEYTDSVKIKVVLNSEPHIKIKDHYLHFGEKYEIVYADEEGFSIKLARDCFLEFFTPSQITTLAHTKPEGEE